MTISTLDDGALWDKFLARWPLENLGQITLQEYSEAGNNDSFTYWLESITEKLGSIWGGSSFKFGVYSRNDKSDKEDGAGRSYSTNYAWYTKYGNTAEEAFEKVRQEIIKVATAARNGDLTQVDDANLGEAVKWKLVFLYQNREKPSVLPIYKAECLRAALDSAEKRVSVLQKQIMENL
jgi:5-methylcytosine-specific restriction protein B